MASSPTLVGDLAAVTGVAAITSVIAHYLRQPLIVGYLLAGLIVGPYLQVPVFADPDRVHALAELGVVLVMFAVGLEFRVARLLQILPVSGFTGLVQVGTLAWCGYLLGQVLGWSTEGALFLGAALSISSTMVVTGVFADQEIAPETRTHVLGVLVFQDVVAIVLIAAMTAVAAGQALEPLRLAVVLLQLAGVLVGLLVAGILVVPRFVRRVTRQAGPATLAVVGVGLAFGFAALAEGFGYSPALGAFVGGIVVAESGKGQEVEHVVAPLRDVFAAIFFVSVGMVVDPRVALVHLPTSLLVSAVIIAAQLGSVGLAGLVSGVPLRRALVAGLALGQIGEFSFILATIGTASGVAPPALQPILVTVAAITAFTTPKLLSRGDRIVSAVDHHLPPRIQNALTLIGQWFDRLRARGGRDHPLREALSAVAIDAVVLVGLAGFALTTELRIRGWLVEQFGWSYGLATAAVVAAVTVFAIPFMIGLFRSARVLAASVAAIALPGVDLQTRSGRAAQQLIAWLVYLAVLLGMGIPGLAVLRPLLGAGLAEAVLVLAVIGASSVLWRRLGDAEGELRSGAIDVARVLAQHAEETVDGTPPAENRAFDGLADVVEMRIELDSAAVNATLAQLDVRARTGATVVAIHKAGANVVFPSALERLDAGDVVAVMGSAEAIELARALISAPAPAASGADARSTG